MFEKAYIPTRLGNWEVPKWHLNRPKGRSTVTKVIANDRGHLLPGVQKTDQKHWAGLYLGTYQLPKRISKKIAIELTNPKCQTWMKRSYHHPFIDNGQQNENENDQLENISSKEHPITNEETAVDRDSIKSSKCAISNVSPVRNRTSADSGVTKSPDDDKRVMERSAGGATLMKTPSSPALSRISAGYGDAATAADGRTIRETAEAQLTAVTPHAGRRYGDAQRHHRLPDAIEDAVYRSLQTKREKNPGMGLNGCWPKCSAVAYKSFNDPGPTQCSKLRVYRPKTSSSSSSSTAATTSDGGKKNSMRRRGGDSKSPQRPQTCVPVVTAQQLTDIKLALCWDLDTPFDRKGQAPRPPVEPAVFHRVVEQQRSAAQRGGEGTKPQPQNSSAVMGFVKSDADAAELCDDDDNVLEARRMQTRERLLKNRNLSAVMELIPNKTCELYNGDDGRRAAETAVQAAEQDDRDIAAADRSVSNNKPRRSTFSAPSLVCRSSDKNSSSGDKNSSSDDNNERSSNNRHDDDKFIAHDDVLNGSLQQQRTRRRRSPADFSSDHHSRHRDNRQKEAVAAAAAVEKATKNQEKHVFRTCIACDNPTNYAAGGANCKKRADYDAECNHYKMAFKAGVPVSTPVKNRTAAAAKPARLLKVPKPKTTNSDKKKYVIGTLLPPFSMWPGTTARDYPEHWRLTSVYRQAFKPLELRKQPLLQTVYL